MAGKAERALAEAVAAARACRICEKELPLGPRPVLLVRPTSRLLIVSQAPGTRVHETGLPFNDRSGDRLRSWLGIDYATFYANERLGIMPVGLCYPGVDAKGGDRPPMKICAPTWQPRIRPLLPRVELTQLVGSYALLSRQAAQGLDDRDHRCVARVSARVPAAAPSLVAQHRMAQAQSVVRARSGAGAAAPRSGAVEALTVQTLHPKRP
jgi:uracil-DNA glycosylase